MSKEKELKFEEAVHVEVSEVLEPELEAMLNTEPLAGLYPTRFLSMFL
jgi:hypothetical protein